MNSVTIVGRLTQDPELAERGGTKVCDLRIAENGTAEDKPVYIDVTAFRRQAEVCAEHLAKGRLVGITGTLRFRQWEKDGRKQSRHSIDAIRVEFLGSGKRDSSSNGKPQQSAAEPEPVPADF
jgi:single-strand DNA-binding protein